MRNAHQRGALCAHGELRNCLYQRQFRARRRHITLVPPRGGAALPRRRWELSMSIDYEHKNVARAKILRKNATPQERKLWYCFLASYRPRFQRQKPIDCFIADFYCSEAKLIIEIDGSQHFSEEGAQRDLFRTEKLEKHGLQVVRFSNLQIDTEFQNVCAYIDIVVKEMLQPK